MCSPLAYVSMGDKKGCEACRRFLSLLHETCERRVVNLFYDKAKQAAGYNSYSTIYAGIAVHVNLYWNTLCLFPLGHI